MSKDRSLPPVPGTPEAEEQQLYQREYASVRPLKPGPTRIPWAPRSAASAQAGLAGRRQSAEGQGGAQGGASPSRIPINIERDGARVIGTAPGVSRETVRALARGGHRVAATCDLHGVRAEPARARLERFVEAAAARGRHVVLVICGRGLHSGAAGPVLLDLAVEVLGQGPAARHVLAFTSAPPRQGGEGALLVLLRKR